ncbi:MAG: CBS domain-containing protein [Chloroflexota bacterium]
MKAKYIMTRDVVVAHPDMSVKEAADRLRQHRITGLPVVDKQGRVVGVFSLSDAALKRGRRVGEVMTSPAFTVSEEAGLEEVATLMVTHDVNRLPVVRDGRLVGIVARADVIRAVATRHAWPDEEMQERMD